VPAGGSEFEGETGVSIWNDAGSAMMALDVTRSRGSSGANPAELAGSI